MIDIDTTKLFGARPVKIFNNCKVTDLDPLSAATIPRLIEIQMPGIDGAKLHAMWHGTPVIALNDFVRCARDTGDTNIMFVVGPGGGNSSLAEGGNFRLKNTSGATAAIGDVGYIDNAGEYKTTTTAQDQERWCVVTSGAANNADVDVVRRGRVTVNYTGTAPSAGDYLVTSGTAGDAQQQTTMHPAVFAVCTAAGSGGTVQAMLLCHTEFVPDQEVFGYNMASHSTFDFVSTINGTPSGSTLVYGTVTSGSEDTIKPNSTSNRYKLMLHNTTRTETALIQDVDTGTNTITLTAAVPGTWANTDAITCRGQTATGLAEGASYWFELEDSASVAPVLSRAIAFRISYLDSGTATNAEVYIAGTYEATVRAFKIRTQVAGIQIDSMGIVELFDGKFVLAAVTTGTATANSNIGILGYFVAAP